MEVRWERSYARCKMGSWSREPDKCWVIILWSETGQIWSIPGKKFSQTGNQVSSALRRLAKKENRAGRAGQATAQNRTSIHWREQGAIGSCEVDSGKSVDWVKLVLGICRFVQLTKCTLEHKSKYVNGCRLVIYRKFNGRITEGFGHFRSAKTKA